MHADEFGEILLARSDRFPQPPGPASKLGRQLLVGRIGSGAGHVGARRRILATCYFLIDIQKLAFNTLRTLLSVFAYRVGGGHRCGFHPMSRSLVLCSAAVGAFNLFGAPPVLGSQPADAAAAHAAVAAAPELNRKTVHLGTHQVTYIRITPPQLPRLPVQPAPPPRELTPEDQAAEDARAAKTYEQLSFTCMVYVGSPTVTELTWWHEGKRHRAWSNVDFRHLTQLGHLETETHVFSWFPFVSDAAVADIPVAERPAELSLFTAADPAPTYFFEGSEEEMAEVAGTLRGLDYLHAYYQLHREQLAADHAKRMQEAALYEARAAELAKNPPKPPDTVIHFWKVPSAVP